MGQMLLISFRVDAMQIAERILLTILVLLSLLQAMMAAQALWGPREYWVRLMGVFMISPFAILCGVASLLCFSVGTHSKPVSRWWQGSALALLLVQLSFFALG